MQHLSDPDLVLADVVHDVSPIDNLGEMKLGYDGGAVPESAGETIPNTRHHGDYPISEYLASSKNITHPHGVPPQTVPHPQVTESKLSEQVEGVLSVSITSLAAQCSIAIANLEKRNI